MPHRYLHLDVFTADRFAGNQLAVFPDGRGLTAGTMQRIANEMAFSETTFVLPAEAAGTDARMRIFTPAEELPMAGHPTVGSTFALAAEGVIRPGQARFTFGLGVGPTTVDLEWRGDTLAFAWMTQRPPEFGRRFTDAAGIAAGLGVEPSDIVPGLPVEAISCGVTFLFVPLVSRQSVDTAVADRRALARFFDAAGSPELPVFFFTTEPGGDRATAYSRMFAPGLGVAEDPATGSASGPLGCYLVRHGIVSAERAGAISSVQGVRMGRPSRLHIRIGLAGGDIASVQVGGESVLVGRGTIDVD
jgi:trans-2,3-dihydro-3-hydroxyanthranilate isomerase